MAFGPKKIDMQEIALNSLGALVAGFIGSVFILIIVFFMSSVVNIPQSFEGARLGASTNSMFPFILSFITFIGTTLTIMLTYKFLQLTSERYNSSLITYGQIAFFGILTYLFLAPVYIVVGLGSYDSIMILFIIHSLILTFWVSLLLEILHNYKYILTGFYGSFVGLFITGTITILIFSQFSTGFAKLISLLILLPLINTLSVLFKDFFQMVYFYYYQYTNLDQLGDIFYQIEREAAETDEEEEQKNLI